MFGSYSAPGFLAAVDAGRLEEHRAHGCPLPAETTDCVARLVPGLGPTSGPQRKFAASETLRVPILLTASALRISFEPTADNAPRASKRIKNPAATILFPAPWDDEIFARGAHFEVSSRATLRAVSTQSEGLHRPRHCEKRAFSPFGFYRTIASHLAFLRKGPAERCQPTAGVPT